GLPGAVFADEGDAFARPKNEIHVADGPAVAPRITESDVLEHESRRNSLRHRQRVGRRLDGGTHLEEHEQVAEVERLLVNVARRQENVLNHVAPAAERRGEEGERADADFAVHRPQENDYVSGVVSDGAENRE